MDKQSKDTKELTPDELETVKVWAVVSIEVANILDKVAKLPLVKSSRMGVVSQIATLFAENRFKEMQDLRNGRQAKK